MKTLQCLFSIPIEPPSCQSCCLGQLTHAKTKKQSNSTYEKPKCMLKPDKKKRPKFKSKSKWPNSKSNKQSPDETNK